MYMYWGVLYRSPTSYTLYDVLSPKIMQVWRRRRRWVVLNL